MNPDKPLTRSRVDAQVRFAQEVARRPDRPVPDAQLRSRGLTQQDIDEMRAGTWTPPDPPPDPLTQKVQDAVTAQLAPVRDVVESARDSLQSFVDNPHPGAVEATVQAIANVAIAIADAIPAPAPDPVPDPGPPDPTPVTPPQAGGIAHGQGKAQ